MRLAYITRIFAPGNLSTFSLAVDGLSSNPNGEGVWARGRYQPGQHIAPQGGSVAAPYTPTN
jgi:hypothetical protein